MQRLRLQSGGDLVYDLKFKSRRNAKRYARFMLQQEEERPEILICKVVSFDDGFDDEFPLLL